MANARPERLRLASYNVEWMNALFGDDGHLLEDGERSARYEVTRGQQLASLGIVFTAMDADAVAIIEAPDTNGRRSTVAALERFAAHFGLRTRAALIGFPSETEQEIAFLYDPDRLRLSHDPQADVTAPRFDGAFRYDLDTDAAPETIRFSKPPLEVRARLSDGQALRLIAVHAKSKAPHGARNAAAAKRLGIENRRKQLAQCIWLRARVESHLMAGDPLIVLGDFNDGPGLDEFERLFGRSGVEVVLGPEGGSQLYDPHAAMALTSRLGPSPTTARFYLKPPGRYFEALLDFIMVSPDLAARHPAWRIWHPFNDPRIAAVPELHEALLAASDHFPVTLDLPLN